MSKVNFNFNYPINLEIKTTPPSFLNKKRKTKVIINVHPDDQDDYNNFVNTEIGQKLLNKVWKKHYSEMKEKNILESVAQIVISNALVRLFKEQERLN
ncbi:hypothetical protein [Candidatus Pelagibacter sp. HIMB1623]|uniref:hypothetical protein n=1 Tax=Candidatus Pelagibacter sp. HIMB1623 TaxID=3413358 RepID=UPI003F83F64B